MSGIFFGLAALATNADPKKTALNTAVTNMDAAKKLSQIMLTKEQHKQTLDAILNTSLQIAQSKAQIEEKTIDSKDASRKLAPHIEKLFSYESFIDENAKSIAQRFSNEEIGELVKFLQTKIGQKWLLETPNLVNSTMTVAQKRFNQEVPPLIDKLVLNIQVPKVK